MASGVPCVVTDAGDSAKIVGQLGEVVEIGDPKSLSAGIIKMIDRRGSLPASRIRGKIVDHWGIEAFVKGRELTFQKLTGK